MAGAVAGAGDGDGGSGAAELLEGFETGNVGPTEAARPRMLGPGLDHGSGSAELGEQRWIMWLHS